MLQGVKLLFYNSAADVLLLDIPSSIPNWFKPFYIGALTPLLVQPKSVSTCRVLLPLSCCM